MKTLTIALLVSVILVSLYVVYDALGGFSMCASIQCTFENLFSGTISMGPDTNNAPYPQLERAVQAKDVRLCNTAEDPNQSDYSAYFCKGDYAILTQDVDYCRTLDSFVKYPGTTSLKNYCLRELAGRLGRTDLCNEITLPGDPTIESQLRERCKQESTHP